MNIRDLAAELGCTKQTVHRHLGLLGITPTRQGKAFEVTELQAARLRLAVKTAKAGRPRGAKDSYKRERAKAG